MAINQHTLREAVHLKGIGVHSGALVSLSLYPAPANTGVVFRRIDLNPGVEVAATVANLASTNMSSNLCQGGVTIGTVEHLLAALAGLGVDNVYADLNAGEIPIMDGSASCFIAMIEPIGLVDQGVPKRFIKIKAAVRVEHGDKWASLTPHPNFAISFVIDYDHPVFRAVPQSLDLDLYAGVFVKELSRARTFGMLSDYEKLRAANLAKGSSLDNAVVVDECKVLNPEGLRYPDEFVRHKALDAFGDLSLLGHSMIGKFSGYKSGHMLNSMLTRKLLAAPEAWEFITVADCNS